MDLIIVSDLIQKLGSIFLFKNKTSLQDFIDDPLMLDLSHLDFSGKVNYFQFGGNTPAVSFDNLKDALTLDPAAAATNPAAALDPSKAQATNPAAAAANTAAPANTAAAATNPAAAATNTAAPANPAAAAQAQVAGLKPSDAGGDVSQSLNNIEQLASDTKEENPMFKLLEYVTKMLLYPLLFIFLVIYPYIYVSMKSFKKLRKLYKKNVLSM